MNFEERGNRAGNPPSSQAIKLVGAWLLVGLPLVWGVWQVFQKSLALFR
jgi:hypothetical protein